jgi:ketosteroid isomerase-like protein
MTAKSPEDICRLFQHYMAKGDIESVQSVYDPEAVFLNQSAEITNGRQGLRQELAPLAAMKAHFDFDIRQVIQTGDSSHAAARHAYEKAGFNVGISSIWLCQKL